MRSPSPTARRRAAALAIPLLAIAGIAVHLALGGNGSLIAVLVLGGVPLLAVLAWKLFHGEIGADLLAGISIVTAAILGEYLAGAIVVLMLSGGEALEKFAVARASSVLRALAARMPSTAHRKTEAGLVTIEVSSIAPGDEIVVLAHEICPADGVVIEGHGAMDEAYLTGEPYVQSKAKGSTVLSGAVNGDHALTVRATRRAQDSRYAAIVEVMRRTEESRPRLRRLGDRLGAIYTPVAIACAAGAYFLSGSPTRALSVLVVATPCPLILAIPVAIIGGISLAARRGIVVRDPAVLERLDTYRTAIFDKTGTLTYGKPVLTELVPIAGFDPAEAVLLAGSLERYSKHPLAAAVVEAARQRGIDLVDADEIAEPPGQGLSGIVRGHAVALAGRRSVAASLPPSEPGLEAVLLVDGSPAALLRFRDEPRDDTRPFLQHLGPRHGIRRVLLVSGDRTAEVTDLARRVGIEEVHGGTSPEEKVAIVRRETEKAPTLFVGDGINDAPAIAAATVGLAFGRGSDITAEAAGAVLLEPSLVKVDELFHVARRLRRVALESAGFGMALSVGGMALAALGHLSPVAGAVFQEIIDVLAIANALRAGTSPARLHDFEG